GTCHFAQARRGEEELRRSSAGYMHLFVRLTLHPDAHPRRGEGPRDCSRRQEERPPKNERRGNAAGGGRYHVPDDRLARVEVRGPNEKDAALLMLLCDPR